MRFFFLVALFVLSIPFVCAEEIGDSGGGGDTNVFIDFPDWEDVIVEPLLDGVTDFFTDFVKELFSAPINQLLEWFRNLLGHEYDFEELQPVWNLIRYIISIFYGLLLLWSGFKFLISSSDPVARDNAKTTIKNIILMIIFVQASYLIFSWLGEIASGLTNGVLNLVPEGLFELTTDLKGCRSGFTPRFH